jgi:hypothetical protein
MDNRRVLSSFDAPLWAKPQLFFEILYLHGQLADLLIQLRFHGLMGVPVAGAIAAEELRKMLQSLLLPLVNLGCMNTVFGRNLVDRLVSCDGLYGYTRLELTGMLPSLCHNSLVSDATIPQRHYLIYWSEKVGVL